MSIEVQLQSGAGWDNDPHRRFVVRVGDALLGCQLDALWVGLRWFTWEGCELHPNLPACQDCFTTAWLVGPKAPLGSMETVEWLEAQLSRHYGVFESVFIARDLRDWSEAFARAYASDAGMAYRASALLSYDDVSKTGMNPALLQDYSGDLSRWAKCAV